MSEKGTSEEKNLPPSAKKLKLAREKGQIARSRELVTAITTVVGLAVLALRTPKLFDQFAASAEIAGRLAANEPFATALSTVAPQIGLAVAGLLGPLIVLLVASVLVSNVAVNGGLVFAIDPVLPKLEHLDPIAGLQRLVALRNWIELFKTLLKLTLVIATAVLLLRGAIAPLVELPTCGLLCAPGLLCELLQPLLIAASLGFLLVGFFDISVQRWLFRRDMRMSRTEQKRERKEQEGDPLIKRRNKREHRASANSRMRAGLRNATFVVRSGSVTCAMRYAHPDAQVPILVARGRGEMASTLVEQARTLNIPVIYDPSVAATIDKLKVGMMITKAMFPPVIACMREARVL